MSDTFANKKIYPDVSTEQRYALMKEHAYSVVKDNVNRHFEPYELQAKKETLAENSIAIMDAEEEIKRLTAPHKEIIKDKKASNKLLTKDLRKKSRSEVEEVFNFEDRENGQMHSYDVEGNYLSSRKLLPSERQGNIKPINQHNTGTHG